MFTKSSKAHKKNCIWKVLKLFCALSNKLDVDILSGFEEPNLTWPDPRNPIQIQNFKIFERVLNFKIRKPESEPELSTEHTRNISA